MLIGEDYYVCELSYNSRAFFVSLFCIEDESKHKVLEMEDNDKTKGILKSFKNNYDLFARNIRIVNGYIKIKKPKFN